MTRKEVIGDCELYLGDCLEVLPTLGRVDAVVTDPPYGIDGGSGGDTRFGKGKYLTDKFKDNRQYILTVCVPIINALKRRNIPMSLTPGNKHAFLYSPPDAIGCFWTPAAITHGPWGFNTFHVIMFYGKDWKQGKGQSPCGIMVTESAPQNGHPCTKPTRAWSWLVEKTAPPHSTILDPFMGSGTTGVACVQLDRKFIGIEIEERYFDIACRRIEDAYKQPKLFSEKPRKPEQQSLLDNKPEMRNNGVVQKLGPEPR